MSTIIAFLNGVWGRAIRIVLGLAMIGYGLGVLGDSPGLLVAIVGVVPLGLGIWGHCLLELLVRPAKPAAE